MAQQPKVFKKNFIDLDFPSVSITITDGTATNTGQNFVSFLRNRDNNSGWATTGSNDAANTVVLVDLAEEKEIDTILLIQHNLKAYTVQHSTDNISYSNFSTTINETTNAVDTTQHQFNLVSVRYIKLTISGTMVTDADKYLRQFIITSKVQGGQFIGWPTFKRVQLDAQKKKNSTISGKVHLKESITGYSTSLQLKAWPENAQADFTMIDSMFFDEVEGFLFWPCGGDESQFRSARLGFRLKDIYLCKIASEYQIEYYQDVYKFGQNMSLSIVEII